MNEMPSITSSAYASNTVDHMQAWGGLMAAQNMAVRGGLALGQAMPAMPAAVINPKEEMMGARIVKVFIADADENVPLDKRVLYSGEEKLTDLTDQELFFDVPIGDLLKAHNEVRATTIDKKQSEKFGRDINLEPARIRDLKMVVVTVAAFS